MEDKLLGKKVTRKLIVDSLFDSMRELIMSANPVIRIEIRDFGVFEVVQRKQKIGRNPKNASVPILIPARKAVKFTPGKKMRKLIDVK